jgi:ABC-2 type transport system permease protein
VSTELRDPGFRATLAAEWTKFASLRSARVILVAGGALGVAVTALLGWVVLATWDDWSAQERASFSVAETALVGTVVTSLLFVVLGVTAVSSEYSSRMAALTFTTTPRRGRVLLAKVVVVGAATFAATAVSVAGMVLVAQVMFAGLDRPGPGPGRFAWLLLGVAANAALSSAVTVSVTFLVRGAAGAVAALLGLTFLPLALGPLLPSWWAEHGQHYLPGAAMDALTLPTFADSPDQLGRGVALLVVIGWLAAALGAAWVALERRDA